MVAALRVVVAERHVLHPTGAGGSVVEAAEEAVVERELERDRPEVVVSASATELSLDADLDRQFLGSPPDRRPA